MPFVNRIPAISFDDVLIEPNYSDVKRGEADVTPKPFKNGILQPKIPIISSAMSSVTELDMVVAMFKLGGLPVHHRYCEKEKIMNMVEYIEYNILAYPSAITQIPIAVGSIPSHKETIDYFINRGCRFFCVDVANGTSKGALETLKYIRERLPLADLMSGNVATPHQARLCIDAGANIIRVGIGAGSVCVTRVKTGCGIPMLQSILDISKMIKYPSNEKERELFKDVILVSDGGIRNSGDLVKALAAGANYVILGKLLAGSKESPGEVRYGKPGNILIGVSDEKLKDLIAKAIIDVDNGIDPRFNICKPYIGMASKTALVELNHKDPNHLHVEGEETTVAYTGPVVNTINELVNGLKQALFYTGSHNLEELKNVTFRVITNNGVIENGPHGIAKI